VVSSTHFPPHLLGFDKCSSCRLFLAMAAIVDFAASLAKLGADYGNMQAWKDVVAFCNSHWEIPAAFAVSYLTMVFATRRKISPHRFSGVVDTCFAAWNLGLSLFSCWGFYNMALPLQRVVRNEGLYFSVCADTASMVGHFKDYPAMFALALFCLSKIPELGDTVFLILKRRDVRLLQWYHHTTVMLFCWLALATEYIPGIWFAVTNYFVHSIMYMYFFLMTFKGWHQKILKTIAPFITIIQTTQMVWGLFINGIAVVSYFTTGACQIQSITVYCAVVMYASYFWLFSKLYLESRAAASKKKQPESVARSISRHISHAFLDDGEEDGADDGEKKEKVN